MPQWVLFRSSNIYFYPWGWGLSTSLFLSLCRPTLKVVSSAASNLKQSQQHSFPFPTPRPQPCLFSPFQHGLTQGLLEYAPWFSALLYHPPPWAHFWIGNKLFYFCSYWLWLFLGAGVIAPELWRSICDSHSHTVPQGPVTVSRRAKVPTNPLGTTFTPPGAPGMRQKP